MRKDQAFKKNVQLNPQQICILCCPQTIYVIPPETNIQKVNKEPAKTPTKDLGPT